MGYISGEEFCETTFTDPIVTVISAHTPCIFYFYLQDISLLDRKFDFVEKHVVLWYPLIGKRFCVRTEPTSNKIKVRLFGDSTISCTYNFLTLGCLHANNYAKNEKKTFFVKYLILSAIIV